MVENRDCQRIKCHLYIHIRDIKNQWEIDTQCFNTSMKGIGFEIVKAEPIKLNIHDDLEMWLHLSDEAYSIHRYGQMIWLKQITPFCYQCGIQIESKKQSTMSHRAGGTW